MTIKRGSSAETEQPEAEGMVLSFDSPESSLIQEATYDPDTRIARVRLRPDRKHTTGKTYDYDLPAKVWTEWTLAPSKGTFFSTRIRPMYAGRIVQ